MYTQNSCLYLLFDCRAPSVQERCTRMDFYIFFIVPYQRGVPLNLLKATKHLKGKSVLLTTASVYTSTGCNFLYSAFFSNYISFLGLAFPYVTSFITEGDILRNKPSQITSVPNNSSEAEWERTMKCQYKHPLRGWKSQRTEISVCSKTYKSNFYAIISFGTSF